VRGVQDLVAENRLDFRRPEELVLEVDESFGGLEGANLGLENPEVTFGRCRVNMLGHGAHDLNVHIAGML
jgi:hypothetical protein